MRKWNYTMRRAAAIALSMTLVGNQVDVPNRVVLAAEQTEERQQISVSDDPNVISTVTTETDVPNLVSEGEQQEEQQIESHYEILGTKLKDGRYYTFSQETGTLTEVTDEPENNYIYYEKDASTQGDLLILNNIKIESGTKEEYLITDNEAVKFGKMEIRLVGDNSLTAKGERKGVFLSDTICSFTGTGSLKVSCEKGTALVVRSMLVEEKITLELVTESELQCSALDSYGDILLTDGKITLKSPNLLKSVEGELESGTLTLYENGNFIMSGNAEVIIDNASDNPEQKDEGIHGICLDGKTFIQKGGTLAINTPGWGIVAPAVEITNGTIDIMAKGTEVGGICAVESNITVEGGTITVNSSLPALKGNTGVAIGGNCKLDLTSTDSNGIYVPNGDFEIKSGTLTVNSYWSALNVQGEEGVTIDGNCELDLTSTNDAGIYVPNGGFEINSGTLTVNSYWPALNVQGEKGVTIDGNCKLDLISTNDTGVYVPNGNINITGGILTAAAKDYEKRWSITAKNNSFTVNGDAVVYMRDCNVAQCDFTKGVVYTGVDVRVNDEGKVELTGGVGTVYDNPNVTVTEPTGSILGTTLDEYVKVTVPDMGYTGGEIEPEPEVVVEKTALQKTLVKGTDYTLANVQTGSQVGESCSFAIEAVSSSGNVGSLNAGNFLITAKKLAWDVSELVVSKVVDGTTDAADVQGELKLSGVVDGENVTVTYDGITASAFPSAVPGEYDVTLTVSNPQLSGEHEKNYRLPTDMTFTVTATIETRQLEIEGNAVPKLSGTYGDTLASMLPADTTNQDKNGISGKWVITESGADSIYPVVGADTAYEISFVSEIEGYLPYTVSVVPVVAKKQVTVQAENKQKLYGEANPTFTIQIPAGALVAEDTESALGVSLSCEATEHSPVQDGGYAITGTSSSACYDVTVTEGTLTVLKAAQAPNMPETTMEVESSYTKVGDISLTKYAGWDWQESDKEKELQENQPITATAVYKGDDAGNYEKESVEISITRQATPEPSATPTPEPSATPTPEPSTTPSATPTPVYYPVFVEGGYVTAVNGVAVPDFNGSVPCGASVTVSVRVPAGLEFVRWQVLSDRVQVSNPRAASFTFTMPEETVTFRAICVTDVYDNPVTPTPTPSQSGETYDHNEVPTDSGNSFVTEEEKKNPDIITNDKVYTEEERQKLEELWKPDKLVQKLQKKVETFVSKVSGLISDFTQEQIQDNIRLEQPDEEKEDPSEKTVEVLLQTTQSDVWTKALEPKDRQKLLSGESVRVYTQTKDVTNKVGEEEKQFVEETVEQISKVLNDGKTDSAVKEVNYGMLLDVSLMKQVGAGTPKEVRYTSGKVTVSMQMPKHLKNTTKDVQRVYQAAVVSDGRMVLLDTKYNTKTGELMFATDTFGRFLLLYTDVPVTE